MAKIKKYQAGGKTPTTPKEISFAKLAAPKDKITFADKIAGAKGKAKGGAKLKKQAAIAIAMKAAGKKPKKARGGATLSPSKSSTSSKLASYGRPIGKNLSGSVKKAKGGAKMGKCRGGCY